MNDPRETTRGRALLVMGITIAVLMWAFLVIWSGTHWLWWGGGGTALLMTILAPLEIAVGILVPLGLGFGVYAAIYWVLKGEAPPPPLS